jgi:hypothetical protein
VSTDKKEPAPYKVQWEKSLLRESKLALPAIAVLMAYASYGSKHGTSIRPKQETVAEDLGTSSRTVRKWLDLARDSGWIVRTHESTGKGDVDHYRLSIPETTGTFVPVIEEATEEQTTGTNAHDHRNDRAAPPERTRTTTGTIVPCTNPVRTQHQPTTNTNSVWDEAEAQAEAKPKPAVAPPVKEESKPDLDSAWAEAEANPLPTQRVATVAPPAEQSDEPCGDKAWDVAEDEQARREARSQEAVLAGVISL